MTKQTVHLRLVLYHGSCNAGNVLHYHPNHFNQKLLSHNTLFMGLLCILNLNPEVFLYDSEVNHISTNLTREMQ